MEDFTKKFQEEEERSKREKQEEVKRDSPEKKPKKQNPTTRIVKEQEEDSIMTKREVLRANLDIDYAEAEKKNWREKAKQDFRKCRKIMEKDLDKELKDYMKKDERKLERKTKEEEERDDYAQNWRKRLGQSGRTDRETAEEDLRMVEEIIQWRTAQRDESPEEDLREEREILRRPNLTRTI